MRVLGLVVLAVWSASGSRGALELLGRWDAQWYAGIATDGYGTVVRHEDGRLLSDFAFFPLLPTLERGVAWASGLGPLEAGLVVTAAASVVAAWGIFAVGEHLYDRRTGTLLVALWAALPIAIVTSMAYSESLFTAFAAWSLHAAMTGRWVWAGLLASLAGLTRPVGVAVAAAVVVSAAVVLLRRDRAAPGAPSRVWPLVTGALLAPMGWLAYVGWVGVQTGRPLGYFEVTDRWGNGFDGGVAFGQWILGYLTSPSWPTGVLLCASVVAVLLLVAWGVRARLPLPLLVFMGVSVVLAFTTAGYFGSKPRYLLPVFPLLIPLTAALARVRLRRTASALVAMTVASSAYGAFWLNGTGPP